MSFRQIHQLAERARRQPGAHDAHAVLHDLLLEQVPAYAAAIKEAHDLQARVEWRGAPWDVWFFPTRLNRTTERYGTTHLAFEVHRSNVTRDDLDTGRHDHDELDRALVMYRARRPP